MSGMDNEPAESVVSFYEYCLLYFTERDHASKLLKSLRLL